MSKILKVTVKVEEFEMNDGGTAFERTDNEYEFSSETTSSSFYEALIRGTDAALADYRGRQKK